MTLFALFRSVDDPAGLPQAVADKFSWFAALLPPVHALAHRLWGQFGLFILGLGAILAASVFIGAEAAAGLYVLLALACGFAAAGARSRAYRRRGLAPAGHRLAADADLARLAVLEARP
ncbi:MAG: hypothetical protein KIT02_12645 [Devosia sp.]|uniref:DUF2628 domain-containing protein n=1 Tax=Devosia sp. TaxID=1871048 RepID=UPI0024C51BA6|nr:DUF2628 domain-containing protein [Devosia sp.]UYN98780.1 MAG: hypothetical protein KIT02_12645 [Devosia sp.]